MANHHKLDVQLRDILGKKVKHLRQQGLLPATIYGKGIEPISVQINERDFNVAYRKTGRTSLIDLNIPGRTMQSAFVHAVQRHPVTRTIIHADFRVVDLRQPVTVEVPVLLVGESPLVRSNDALLTHGVTTLQVRALPDNLPQHIEVDISGLDSFDVSIYVRDLPPHDQYTIMGDGDGLLATLTQLRATEEPEAAEATEEPAEPELIRRERKTEEEE